MGGLLSQAVLDQIRAASDIVEIIGSYLPLKRAGANFVALCPFHKEKTPSFNVHPQRQIFHCFGCHKGGDVFRFIQDFEGVNFAEAVRRLAERARIPLEYSQDDGQRQRQHLKESLLQIHEGITQRWHQLLTNDARGQVARDYLHQRGLPPAAIPLFRLGYAPESWDDTVNWAASKGLDLAMVEQAGLILRKENSAHYYDRFRGRLIFPICDDQSRVIGFSGRTLRADDKSAKYVNSPETPIFSKGRVFFGLDKAKRALLDRGFALVCEGQLDLIACFLAGIENVVAPQGTAFTPEHARILKRYVDDVVLCFDADTAGQNAAVRVQESLLTSGLAVRVMTLPPPHDPDSFIRAFGAHAFQERLDQAREFLDFYLDHLASSEDVATDKGQLAVVRAMAEMVQQTGNAVLIDKYAQKTAMKLAAGMQMPLSPDAVRAQFKKTSRKTAPGEPGPAEAQPAQDRPSTQEFWLLKLLLSDETLLDWAAAHLAVDWIRHDLARRIIEARLSAHRQQRHEVAALLTEFDDPNAQRLISEAVADPREIPNRPQQLADLARRLRDATIDRQLATLAARVAQPALTDAERLELLRAQQELRARKREPLPLMAA
jgi:DNA primase